MKCVVTPSALIADVESAEPNHAGSNDEVTVNDRPRILLAEDDDDFRALLAQWLEVDGYRVAAVATGRALLTRLAAMDRGQDPPALVITDDRMPGLVGSEALRTLREHGCSIPMILITAFGTDELVMECERRRITVFKKPFEIDDLRTAIAWLVTRTRSC